MQPEFWDLNFADGTAGALLEFWLLLDRACTHLDLLPIGHDVRGTHNGVVHGVERLRGGADGQVQGVAAQAHDAELRLLRQHSTTSLALPSCKTLGACTLC